MEYQELSDEINDHTDECNENDIDNNIETARVLQEVSVKLEDIQDSGEIISPFVMEALNISIKHILSDLGVKDKSGISTEAFSNTTNKTKQLKIAIEGIGDWIDAIYDKIYQYLGTVKEWVLGTNRTLKSKAKSYIAQCNDLITKLKNHNGLIKENKYKAEKYLNILPFGYTPDSGYSIKDNLMLKEVLLNFNRKSKAASHSLHILPNEIIKEGKNINAIIKSTSILSFLSSKDMNVDHTRFAEALVYYNNNKQNIVFNAFNTEFKYNPNINYTFFRSVTTLTATIVAVLYAVTGRSIGIGAVRDRMSKQVDKKEYGGAMITALFGGFLSGYATGLVAIGGAGGASNLVGQGVNVTAYRIAQPSVDMLSEDSYIYAGSVNYSDLIKSLEDIKNLSNTMINTINNHEQVLYSFEEMNRAIRKDMSERLVDNKMTDLYRRTFVVSNINLARQYVSTVKKASKTMLFTIDNACEEMLNLVKKASK